MTQTTQGTVVSVDQSNHGAVKYEYLIGGTRYLSGESPGGNYALGSSYPVHYDPMNPQISVLGEIPAPMNVISLVEVLGLFTTCFVLIYLFGLRSFRRDNTITKIDNPT